MFQYTVLTLCFKTPFQHFARSLVLQTPVFKKGCSPPIQILHGWSVPIVQRTTPSIQKSTGKSCALKQGKTHLTFLGSLCQKHRQIIQNYVSKCVNLQLIDKIIFILRILFYYHLLSTSSILSHGTVNYCNISLYDLYFEEAQHGAWREMPTARTLRPNMGHSVCFRPLEHSESIRGMACFFGR